MKKFLFLLLTIVGYLTLPAQSPHPKDSLYFVRLHDGTLLHSANIKLLESRAQGKYLLLDNSRQIFLGLAKEFNTLDGTFAIGNIGNRFDTYKVEIEGPRISLYSKCYFTTSTVYAANTPGGTEYATTVTSQQKAYYFRKEPDGDIQNVNLRNLQLAMADNPASMHQLRIARANIYVGIGLFVAGAALVTTGIIQGVHRNNDAQTAYKSAADTWFNSRNPNAPLPQPPGHYGPSALFYIGLPTLLSGFIPILTANGHAQKALSIYNQAN